MAYCGNCGSPINGGKFCPKCGASLEQMSIQKDAVQPSTFNQKLPSRIVGIIGAFLLFSPMKATNLIVRMVGLGIYFDGVMNLVVVTNTVKTIKKAQKEIIDID